MRVDANVPIKNGRVESAGDFRLRAVLDEIESLCKRGARVVLLTHLGRPNGKHVARDSTHPIAVYFSKALHRPIHYIDGIVGSSVERKVERLQPGEIAMLENVRFDKREERNDAGFAKELAKLGDVYVNNGFGVSHRKHASVHAITRSIKSYAGDLLVKEVEELSRPFRSPSTLIIGGIKLETKVPVIEKLAWEADSILLGGGVAVALVAAERNMRLKAGTVTISRAELEVARQILERYAPMIHLPVDFLVGDRRVRSVEDLKSGDALFDIGPKSVRHFSKILTGAKTILWNGPMGDISKSTAQRGTLQLAKVITRNKVARSVVGGGDTVAFLEKHKLAEKFRFVSTGGGAMLEFLGGENLPGLDVLK